MKCSCGNKLQSAIEHETSQCDSCWSAWVNAVAQAAVNGALSTLDERAQEKLLVRVAVKTHAAKGGSK